MLKVLNHDYDDVCTHLYNIKFILFLIDMRFLAHLLPQNIYI